MLNINRKITPYNYTRMTNKRNMWIVIHYVGAVSTAKNNADYFYTANRGASANYFVDEKEVWQVVEDTDAAWHVGGATKYYNSCRNNNSIGIELCCKKDNNGNWYFEPETINNAVQLVAKLMKKWSIPIERLTTHHATTGKICPEPFVRNPEAWADFKKKVMEVLMEENEISLRDKQEKIKEIMHVDDNTILYYSFYRYNEPLFDKLYAVCIDAEKWRKSQA